MYSGKVVVFEQKLLIFGQSCCIQAKVCIRTKVVLFGKSCGIWTKVVVFGHKRLYSGKNI